MNHRYLLSACCVAMLACCFVTAGTALADPPDHAKAHGWRKKNDPRYLGYTGREWQRDYGIIEGNCNRKEIGTVIGAAIGGAIGSQVGDGGAVAIIVGTVLGAAIGRKIGGELDEGDRACVGHALELAKPGQAVRWLNDRTQVSYLFTPLPPAKDDAKNCRKFTLKAQHDGKSETSNGQACRDAAGIWKIVG